jgi:hypothetical protein
VSGEATARALGVVGLHRYDAVRLSAVAIANRIKRTGAGRMPPAPYAPSTAAQTALFDKLYWPV